MTTQKLQKSPHSKPAVLIIEDNIDEWFLIQWAFSNRFPQLKLVWLMNGEEVIPYLENHCRHDLNLPILITVDLYLPDSREFIPSAHVGIGIIQSLKSHHLYRKIPLVTLSRSAHADDISEAFKYSTNSYVVKPDDHLGWLETINDFSIYWPDLEKEINSQLSNNN